ncbi:hemolysin family protein [Desulfobacter sp. UBA2225]|uniref:hemolysin family protein n=1 Tax=Desulfobacter sp. UBA2225 TaxID=1961413 RepID=UPI002580983A|nr:hemolysin family protein [Desulfobacter sp. UBA2225]
MLYFELLIVVFLTVTNGLLAMSELAVVSSRRSRLEHLANQGSRGARAALRLIDDPSRFLSTVQIGITLVGVIAGAFSGATLGQRLGIWLNTFPSFSSYGHSIGMGITVVGITYLSLIIGELVPKRIALTQPERVASLVAGPMRGLSLVAAPAVWVLHISTERVLRLLGLTGTRETTVTEDEVKSLIAEGTQAGIFVPQEQDMIEGVLRLADRSVRLIMTPRTRIVWVNVKSDRNMIIDMVRSHRFSRLLVCDGTVDHPVGFIHTKNLLPEALSCEEVTLSELVTPILYVPDRTTVLNLLNRFKKEKVHLAVVVNEYGTTEGLVTLTDVIEAIAGDLPERGEDDGPQIVQRDDGSWLVNGTVPTDEVETLTGIYMGEKVEMLAGFVLDHLGRIPKAGASFNHGSARFEVVDMDGNRIDKLLIAVDPKSDRESTEAVD